MTTELSQKQHGGTAAAGSADAAMAALLRRTAAEGAVLLENAGVLPLRAGTRVALFGRGQIDWFYTGYGSGGDVRRPYTVSLLEGVRACAALQVNEELAAMYEAWSAAHPIDHGDWGTWPRHYPEMPLANELVRRAAAQSDCAVVTIGRSSGEDRENVLEEGSFYLTKDERQMLSLVTAQFAQTVVLLNIGSVMDLSWIEEYRPAAVLLLWQGGMESGNAAADLLCGAATPNGRLTDTVARTYADHPSSASFGGAEYTEYVEDIYVGYRWFETFCPDRVLYPFGYGLGYTDFEIQTDTVVPTAEGFEVTCTVTNTGAYVGRETVQVYVEKPCGALGNPARVLGGFAKTAPLQPNERQTVAVTVPRERLASFDDRGVTGTRFAEVIEAGTYGIAVGRNVREAVRVYTYEQPQTECVRQLSDAGAPRSAFSVYAAEERDGVRRPVRIPAAQAESDLREVIEKALPAERPTANATVSLSDVEAGRATLAEFAAGLSIEELEAISRGADVMDSPLGAAGNAGVLGGVLPSLREKGVPPVTTTDGPSGIRLQATCSLIPIGTLLACTFDEALVREVYAAVGCEMHARGSHVLLAPGMNLHRNPLCGRNFEYYSEDPYLTGKIAAAAVNGLQEAGVSACPKHFACNNQEFRRNACDSRLSARALRELYLKGFEICIKQAHPHTLMTSYNRINGVYGHYQYDLCTRILREEWGFDGCVMTDWWMQHGASPEFPPLKDNAYRVRAQVDVLMPGGWWGGPVGNDGTLLETLGKPDGITTGELHRTAENVLRFVLRSAAMRKKE